MFPTTTRPPFFILKLISTRPLPSDYPLRTLHHQSLFQPSYPLFASGNLDGRPSRSRLKSSCQLGSNAWKLHPPQCVSTGSFCFSRVASFFVSDDYFPSFLRRFSVLLFPLSQTLLPSQPSRPHHHQRSRPSLHRSSLPLSRPVLERSRSRRTSWLRRASSSSWRSSFLRRSRRTARVWYPLGRTSCVRERKRDSWRRTSRLPLVQEL